MNNYLFLALAIFLGATADAEDLVNTTRLNKGQIVHIKRVSKAKPKLVEAAYLSEDYFDSNMVIVEYNSKKRESVLKNKVYISHGCNVNGVCVGDFLGSRPEGSYLPRELGQVDKVNFVNHTVSGFVHSIDSEGSVVKSDKYFISSELTKPHEYVLTDNSCAFDNNAKVDVCVGDKIFVDPLANEKSEIKFLLRLIGAKNEGIVEYITINRDTKNDYYFDFSSLSGSFLKTGCTTGDLQICIGDTFNTGGPTPKSIVIKSISYQRDRACGEIQNENINKKLLCYDDTLTSETAN